MPIVFRCNNCEKKLSVSRRKAGTDSTCPECGSAIRIPASDDINADVVLDTQTVPAATDLVNGGQAEPRDRKSALLLAAIAAALIAAVSVPLIVFSLSNRIGGPHQQAESGDVQQRIVKSSPRESDIDRVAYHRDVSKAKTQAKPSRTSGSQTSKPAPHTAKTSGQPNHSSAPKVTPRPDASKAPQKGAGSNPKSAAKKDHPPTAIDPPDKTRPNNVPPRPSVPQKTPPGATNPKRPVLVLNPFGNPINRNVGLALDGEFKGKKLLVWGGFRREVNVFLGTNNPLWAALRKKGFDVAIRTGPFDRRWLLQADQLWIFSSPTKDPYELVAAANLDLVVGLMPESALPPGWTKNDMTAVFRACLRYPGGVFNLSPRDCLAVRNFVRSGKGLFLLAENDPATHEAKLLGRMLFGTTVSGNYPGTRIAFVKERGLPPAVIRKYGGQYPVDDHPLLKGVNFIFEGVTVSTFRPTESLHVVMPASDGKPLIGVSRIPGQRIVLDCGYTRYYFGPTPASQFIVRTAGTIRFAENVAAYLMGKGQQ